MKITLGGDRLGSGNKMKEYLRNYNRSNHNLSTTFASSMSCGILYPCYCKPILKGERFNIKLQANARTIPTQGPLFGSFKLQVDFFQVPVRLYQALLHNNPVEIGLKMAQIKFPRLKVDTTSTSSTWKTAGQFSNSCLLKYLGMSGLGRTQNASTYTFGRYINAIPALAYYDIAKTYYANKQEEDAYVIKPTIAHAVISGIEDDDSTKFNKDTNIPYPDIIFPLVISFEGNPTKEDMLNTLVTTNAARSGNRTEDTKTIGRVIELGWATEGTDVIIDEENHTITLDSSFWGTYSGWLIGWINIAEQSGSSSLNIVPFPLKNIDDMRMELLSYHTMGAAYTIDEDNSYLPYSALVEKDENGITCNKYNLNGLMLKTYQADMFNSWVQTDWIDGENGIAEITKIAVSGGSFKIDALNFAEKLYNMLNRVVVSGNTFQDWEDVVYTESQRRHIESPMYIGGLSSEIVFEEIIQSAPAGDGVLGSLGGRGKLIPRKGGSVNIYAEEASFIIGIASLTPRIYYTQGNEFYMTDIESMDDFHKPAMDGIGFQNLIGERLAWFDTFVPSNSYTPAGRSVIGKLPAWTEYTTDVNKAYGDFAAGGGAGFMILQRDYSQNDNGGIADATTYIDPQKYNYAFAVDKLDAQNFWVQIDMNIEARRLMSAHQIPSL